MNKRELYSDNLFITGLFLFAASLPLSKFTLSISQFFLVVAFLYKPNLKYRLKAFISNKNALLFCAVYLFWVIGLFWTDDFTYAFRDLRIKLPLLLFPLFLAAMSKLKESQINSILLVFTAATITSSLYSLLIYLNFIPIKVNDFRDLSPLISHIRLCLMVSIAIIILVAFLIKREGLFSHLFFQITGIVTIVWFLVFLVLLESLTGFSILILACITAISFQIYYSHNKSKRVILFSLLILIPLLLSFFIYKQMNTFMTEGKVPENYRKYTLNNRPYFVFEGDKFSENGNLFYLYNCPEEMKMQWNKISAVPFDSSDALSQPLRFTLMRYLTSKGLTKDSVGVVALSSQDVANIENGIPNHLVPSLNPVSKRLYYLSYELKSLIRDYNPGGHSLTMRFEFWKTGWHVFKDNLLLGVGTGDVQNAFDKQYEKDHSVLDKQWHYRAHNQYLTNFITLGLGFGLLFLGLCFYAINFLFNRKQFLQLALFSVVLYSMFYEDTLETQSGISLSVFFCCLFLVKGIGVSELNKAKTARLN